MYLIFRFFIRVSRKIFGRITVDFKSLFQKNSAVVLQGKQLKIFLTYFDQEIFVSLLYYLSRLLKNQLLDFQTNRLVDLLNEFDLYLRKYSVFIRILIQNNRLANNFFEELNKTTKNPMISEFLMEEKSSAFTLPKDSQTFSMNNSFLSNCSFSS